MCCASAGRPSAGEGMKGKNAATAKQQQGKSTLLAAFLQCRSYLTRVVGRIVQAPQIEDIIQETFLRSFEASARSEIRHPRAFLARTAVNLALNHVMKADNRTEELSELTLAVSAETLEEEFDAQERFVLFCRAVQRLPLQCRRAFLLKKVYGLSRREVAQSLGVTESTAQKHIAKGTLMCAEYMQGRSSRKKRVKPRVISSGIDVPSAQARRKRKS